MRRIEIHQFGDIYDVHIYEEARQVALWKDLAKADVYDFLADEFDDSPQNELLPDPAACIRALIDEALGLSVVRGESGRAIRLDALRDALRAVEAQ